MPNEALGLRGMHQSIGSWSLSWPDFRARAKEICSSTSEAVKNRELRTKGIWDCARVGIAIKEFSLANQVLPETLSELVPQFIDKLPVEPFFGKPLKYTKDGNTGALSFDYPDNPKQSFTFTVYCLPPTRDQ